MNSPRIVYLQVSRNAKLWKQLKGGAWSFKEHATRNKQRETANIYNMQRKRSLLLF